MSKSVPVWSFSDDPLENAFSCIAAMPREESIRVEVPPSCLDRINRDWRLGLNDGPFSHFPCFHKQLNLKVVVCDPVEGPDGSSGSGNLAVFQPSCFLRMVRQLGTGMVLQLNDFDLVYIVEISFACRVTDY
ncbi:hypothetical protein CSKR_108735 [Clonorchis sinensis]|uniref:Uncharacterized protein n=1 Tax=Clonorchis sinensis TaxID=79923 RepID=A0A3R7FFC6_CLOSI|nr:hypothetical protein CSKR_108735 [Clonorchis sinensis]